MKSLNPLKIGTRERGFLTFLRPIVSIEDALKGANLALILTDHSEFRTMDPSKFAGLMSNQMIVDTRNMLAIDQWKSAGFTVVTLGVGN